MRLLPTLAPTAALSVCLALTACGSTSGDADSASDPAPTGAPTSLTTSAPAPTPVPTTGSYPAYPESDYTYTLRVDCFCLGAGVPVTVTVVDGEVREAVYAGDGGRGAAAGEPAGDFQRLTIDDVIDAANDTDAAEVRVVWPAGQAYPTSVRVDDSLNVADDERGYRISDVRPGPAAPQ